MIDPLLSDGILARWLQKNRRHWRWLIVAAVFGVIVFVSLSPSSWVLPLALIAIVGLALLPFYFRHPNSGLLLLMVMAMYVPYGLGTGSQTSIGAPILLMPVLIAFWLATMLVHDRRLVLYVSRPLTAAAVFTLVSLFAFGIGQLPWFLFVEQAPMRAQIGGLAIYIISFGLMLLVSQQVDTIRWLKWINWFFVVLAGIYIMGRLFDVSFLISLLVEGAGGSQLWIWFGVLTFSHAFFNTELSRPWRLLLGVFLIMLLYVSFVQGRSWVSGWLPLIGALMGVLLIRNLRLGIMVWVTGFFTVAVFWSGVVGLLQAQESYSLLTRLEAWVIVAEITKISPWLGLGPANYYFYTPLFPILGHFVQFNSHNQYVDIVAQTGIIGLLTYCWIFVEALWFAWRLRLKVPTGFCRAYLYAVFGGMIGMLISGMFGDWVLPFVYNVGLNGFRASFFGWLFIGGLIALDRIVKEVPPATTG